MLHRNSRKMTENNQICFKDLTIKNKFRVSGEALLKGHALLDVWILVQDLDGDLSPWTRPLQLLIICTRYQINIYFNFIPEHR